MELGLVPVVGAAPKGDVPDSGLATSGVRLYVMEL